MTDLVLGSAPSPAPAPAPVLGPRPAPLATDVGIASIVNSMAPNCPANPQLVGWAQSVGFKSAPKASACPVGYSEDQVPGSSNETYKMCKPPQDPGFPPEAIMKPYMECASKTVPVPSPASIDAGLLSLLEGMNPGCASNKEFAQWATNAGLKTVPVSAACPAGWVPDGKPAPGFKYQVCGPQGAKPQPPANLKTKQDKCRLDLTNQSNQGLQSLVETLAPNCPVNKSIASFTAGQGYMAVALNQKCPLGMTESRAPGSSNKKFKLCEPQVKRDGAMATDLAAQWRKCLAVSPTAAKATPPPKAAKATPPPKAAKATPPPTAPKTSGDASKTSGGASKTSGDASKTSGGASKTPKTSGTSKTSSDATQDATDAESGTPWLSILSLCSSCILCIAAVFMMLKASQAAPTAVIT